MELGTLMVMSKSPLEAKVPLKHALVVSYVTVAAEPAEVHSLTVRAWAEAARATSAAASVRIVRADPWER